MLFIMFGYACVCVSVLVSHILYLHIKTLRNEKIVLLFFIYIAIQKDIMILIAREVVAVINFTKTSKSWVYYFFSVEVWASN